MTTKQRIVNKGLALVASIRFQVLKKLPSHTEVAPGIVVGQCVSGSDNVKFEGQNSIGQGTSFQGRNLRVGRGSTIGIGCVLNGPLQIGKFTQLGSYVGVYGSDHPIDVAVPNVNRSFLGGQVKGLVQRLPVSIGHGCWIGHGAVVLRGITIGNGSVIGAGSVVTADVPPYTVVAGVPAGAARPRFPSDIAEGLERTQWWDWSDERLQDHRALFLMSLQDDPAVARRMISEILETT